MSAHDSRDSCPPVILVMGVAGSGKSTVGELLSARLGLKFLEGDAFHPAANVARMRNGQALADADRRPWLRRLADTLANIPSNEGAVLACSALKRSYRDILRQGCPRLQIIFLDGGRETIRARMHQRREHFMPPELASSQFETLQAPGKDEWHVVIDIDQPVENIVREAVQFLTNEEGTEYG